MNARYTLILVLVAVALGIFAWTQRETAPVDLAQGSPTPTPAPLFELAPEDVQEVEVLGATGGYTLTRVAGGWEVDGEPADSQVDGLVTRLAQPTIVRELTGEPDPEIYGFGTPSLTVTLKTAAGEARVIQVGADTPVDYNVYIRAQDGQRILIVGQSDITMLKDWLLSPPFAPTATPTGPAGLEGTPDPLGTVPPFDLPVDLATPEAGDASDATGPPAAGATSGEAPGAGDGSAVTPPATSPPPSDS